MGKIAFVFSEEEIREAMENSKKALLDPEQIFGPWFEGNEDEYDEWAGDILHDFTFTLMEKLGIVVT